MGKPAGELGIFAMMIYVDETCFLLNTSDFVIRLEIKTIKH